MSPCRITFNTIRGRGKTKRCVFSVLLHFLLHFKIFIGPLNVIFRPNHVVCRRGGGHKFYVPFLVGSDLRPYLRFRYREIGPPATEEKAIRGPSHRGRVSKKRMKGEHCWPCKNAAKVSIISLLPFTPSIDLNYCNYLIKSIIIK